MASMVRKQLLISIEQERRLKALAAAESRSEGDLVREALDALLARRKAQEQDWKDAWQQAAGIWKDRGNLDAFYAERRARRRQRRERMSALMVTGKSK